MPYATVAEFRARYHQISGSAADESLIGEMLEAATAIIDRYVGLTFGTAAEGDRVIYGDGTDYLPLPAYVAGSITEVTSGGTAITAYVELDGMLVAADADGLVRPSLPGTVLTWPYGYFWREGVPYTVSATWGYADVPADIREACIQIAGRLWQGRNSGYSDVIGVEGGGAVGYQKALPSLVRQILDSYKTRVSLGVW